MLRIKKQVDVLVMADIKKELEFASARLRLVRFDKEAVTNNLTSIELNNIELLAEIHLLIFSPIRIGRVVE